MKKRIILSALILLMAVFVIAGCSSPDEPPTEPVQAPAVEAAPTESVVEVPVQTEPVEPTSPPFTASATVSSDPANWSVKWDVIVDGTITDSYTREEPIFFEDGDYFALPGVASFRGGNYRNEAGYGTADIQEGTITPIWKMHVGFLSTPNWGGCCWTGQPLVVQWDEETKAIMNLYEEKKAKEGLVEVIYAKMDGYVHFFDIDDGSYTRDPMYIGMAFKGGGALDPRGYPILYLGSGLIGGGKIQSIFAVSLIDGSILYERSGFDELAYRAWYAFDGASLVDPETDTLILAGESGLLYTIKLNTQYDKSAGTLTMSPEAPVMARYQDNYTIQGRNNGYESSVTAVENYLYVGNNAGLLHCVDINTMELVWAQDIIDDVNATPLFDWGADGRGYLYVAPSMDYSGYYRSDLPICKVDAQTGEILWTHIMQCGTMEGVPGGFLASPLLGRTGSDIENLIIFSVGCSPDVTAGQMVAMDKETGKVIWQFETDHYMWSSPVALYTESGKSYIFQADARGICYLLDGATGQELSRYDVDTTTEASPVAFGNKVVLGSRARIYLFEIS